MLHATVNCTVYIVYIVLILYSITTVYTVGILLVLYSILYIIYQYYSISTSKMYSIKLYRTGVLGKTKTIPNLSSQPDVVISLRAFIILSPKIVPEIGPTKVFVRPIFFLVPILYLAS